MTDSESNELLIDLNDTVSNEARKALCNWLGAAFSDVGHLLYMLGNIIGPDRKSGASPFENGSDATAGLGLVGQIGGELISAAAQLVESSQYYGAMSVIQNPLISVDLWQS
jgi:hypothetical protein